MYPSVPSNIKSKIKSVNSVLDIYTNMRTYSEKEIKCKLKNYFKFMVSRHPFDRLVSAYNHWFHGNSEVTFMVRYAELKEDHFHGSELERNANGTALMTFEQFLHLVIEEPKRFNNLHWRNYMWYFQPCSIPYDHVIYMENMAADVGIVLDHFTEADGSKPKMPLFNVKRGHNDKLRETTEMFKSVNNVIIDKLLERYQRDFDVFGYTWNNISGAGCAKCVC